MVDANTYIHIPTYIYSLIFGTFSWPNSTNWFA